VVTELCLKGPWIAGSYYKDERTEESMKDGWLYTGDIVTVDSEGCIKIADRTKDLIKSGGEWISSVDLENALMSHDKVLEASVVAVLHEKRPVYLRFTKRGTSSRKRRSVCFTKSRISENICREILKESAA
jgi:fatty-acyl-CoA synthase